MKKNNIVFKQFNVFIKGLLKSHDPNQFTAFKSVSFTDTSNIHRGTEYTMTLKLLCQKPHGHYCTCICLLAMGQHEKHFSF